MNRLLAGAGVLVSIAVLSFAAIAAQEAPAGAGPPTDAARPGADAARIPREYLRVIDRPYQKVGITVEVVDGKGKPVRGLARDDFQIFEDDQPVAIEDFGPEGERRDRPLSVAVLLDMSGSMKAQVKGVKEATRALLGGLRPGDEVMVAKFNDEMTVLQTFTGDP